MRVVLAFIALLAAGSAMAQPFHTGVSGHPLTQEGYREVPVAVQVDLAARLGAEYYRCDLPGDSATPAGLARLVSLMEAARKRGVKILPILFPPVDMGKGDPAEIRKVAREHARAVVGRCKAYTRVWELSNELDAYAMIRKGERDRNGRVWQWGDANGSAPEEFEETRYARARAVLAGLAEGVRDADQTALRIINSSGWLHYGFIKRLVEDAVPFDILSWHWYSEMGEMTRAGGVNVLERITAFGKPIWITEFNRRGGSLAPTTDAEYSQSVVAMVRRYRELSARYPIRAAMVYELLDEPYFGPTNPESHYGLVPVSRGADGKWAAGTPKPAFAAVRDAFARAARGGSTVGKLSPAQQAAIDLSTRRTSSQVPASPFASLTSFEVHGEDEDAGVIDTMARLGVKWVVMHNIHGSLPDPQDRRLNAWLANCKRAGIGVRCILVSRDVDFWVNAVRNYGDRIRNWGYLNEPNAPTGNDHTRPGVPPDQYVKEAAAIRKAIRAVRPNVRLWGPESAMLQCMEETPYPWLRLALEAGLANAVDGLTIHPYRQAYSPRNVPENPSTFEGKATPRYATYEQQVATLRKLAPGKPVSVTEVGWSTAPMGPLNGSTLERITELTQAKFALRQQVQDFALGIDCAVYFLLRERWVDRPLPLGHIENHFGIVHTDNSPKPAYTALQTLYSQLDSRSRQVAGAKVGFSRPGVKWYLFEDSTGRTPVRRLVYWLPVAASDDLANERVDATIGGVKVRDLWLSDCPRILRLHKVAGKWRCPVLVDLLNQAVYDGEW